MKRSKNNNLKIRSNFIIPKMRSYSLNEKKDINSHEDNIKKIQ